MKKNLEQSDLAIKIEQTKKKLLNVAKILFKEFVKQKQKLVQMVVDRTSGAMIQSRALWAGASELK